jgi:hypothetical protein
MHSITNQWCLLIVIYRKGDKQMKHLEILKEVDRKKFTRWLELVGFPLLTEPSFFESMGFPSVFVRQHLRKHKHVLRPGGQIQRSVRGVHEVEFLRGVADALGVRPFEDAWDPRDMMTTRAVARKCLEALPAMESGKNPDAVAVSIPDLTTKMTSSVTGEKR